MNSNPPANADPTHTYTHSDMTPAEVFDFEALGFRGSGGRMVCRQGDSHFDVHAAMVDRAGDVVRVYTLDGYENLQNPKTSRASFTSASVHEVVSMCGLLSKFWGHR